MIIIDALIFFLGLIQLLVIVDVILSWFTLAKINIRPEFIANILDPIYKKLKENITTNIWPFELTPIIIYFLLEFIIWAIYLVFK